MTGFYPVRVLSAGVLLNHLFKYSIAMKLTEEQKQANKEARRLAREQAKKAALVEAEKNQKPVRSIEMNIEWKRSRTWGNCPRLDAYVTFHDGTSDRAGSYASGCGYDKESTVVAEIYNRFLKYKLYQPLLPTDRDREEKNAPYGISISETNRYFEGGVGMSCYFAISQAIGGKLEHVAWGKTFDVWKYTDKQ